MILKFSVLLLLNLLFAFTLFAQTPVVFRYPEEEPHTYPRLYVGADVAKNLVSLASVTFYGKGVYAEPVFKYMTKDYTFNLALGYSKITKDLIYRNLYNYVNEGSYLRLNFCPTPNSEKELTFSGGFGIVLAKYNETGEVVIRNGTGYFPGVTLPFERKNKFAGGFEGMGFINYNAGKKILFVLEYRLGLVVTPAHYNSGDYGRNVGAFYTQGMGYNSGIFTGGITLQVFYRVK